MGPLRRLFELSRLERKVLLKAWALVTIVQLCLGRIPFSTLRRLVVPRTVGRRRRGGLGREYADAVAWAVTAASHRAPGRTTCLSRALTAQALLARAGHGSRLEVGVSRGSAGVVEAHAWVECDGRIVIGGTAQEISQFTRLVSLDVETALGLPAIDLPGAR